MEELAGKVDLDGQNVLMSVDLNVPLSKEAINERNESGAIIPMSSIPEQAW